MHYLSLLLFVIFYCNTETCCDALAVSPMKELPVNQPVVNRLSIDAKSEGVLYALPMLDADSSYEVRLSYPGYAPVMCSVTVKSATIAYPDEATSVMHNDLRRVLLDIEKTIIHTDKHGCIIVDDGTTAEQQQHTPPPNGSCPPMVVHVDCVFHGLSDMEDKLLQIPLSYSLMLEPLLFSVIPVGVLSLIPLLLVGLVIVTFAYRAAVRSAISHTE